MYEDAPGLIEAFIGIGMGYNANPSPIVHSQIKNTLREYLARVKMFIDIYTGKAS